MIKYIEIIDNLEGRGGEGVANIYPQSKRCKNCSSAKIAHLECTISL